VGAALTLVAFMLMGWWVVTNSSTFQLFGDWVARIDTHEKVVALTFDDGPHPVHTPRMLDLLDRLDIRATFFMMGRNVERYPDVAREVVARGHDVGNHSYSHPKMIWMTPAAIRDEIDRADRLLRDVGVTGAIHFRPPHAVKFVVLPYVLSQTGRLSVLGDVDPKEWKQRPAEVMIPAVLDQVRPGSILPFHDPHGAETLKTVDAVVTTLLAQGYRFETVSEFIRRR
jgi:peptidoglycan/xylan/chitin deacetylase (PgdA/CDA1 family)